MLSEHGFDFAEFDAIAANLDLIVNSSEKLDVAVRQVTRQVAGFIQPRLQIVTEWMLNEFLGC